MNEMITVNSSLNLTEEFKDALQSGLKVLIVGMNERLLELPRSFQQSQFMGYVGEIPQMLTLRRKARDYHVSNVQIDFINLTKLDLFYDMDAIIDLDVDSWKAHPQIILHNLYNALKPGGLLITSCEKTGSHSTVECALSTVGFYQDLSKEVDHGQVLAYKPR